MRHMHPFFSYLLLLFVLSISTSCSLLQEDQNFKRFVIKEGLPPKDTKIILIAGSYRSPQYFQEILEQKEFWLKNGYKENEIACYFAGPSYQIFIDNKDQYLNLMNEINKCYLADLEIITSHMKYLYDESLGYFKDPIYVYIATTGAPPISDMHLYISNKFTSEIASWAKRFNDQTQFSFNNYHLELSGSKGRDSDFDKIYKRRDNINADINVSKLFTPDKFTKLFNNFKYRSSLSIIISASLSGSFSTEKQRELFKYAKGMILTSHAENGNIPYDLDTYEFNPNRPTFSHIYLKTLEKYKTLKNIKNLDFSLIIPKEFYSLLQKERNEQKNDKLIDHLSPSVLWSLKD